MSNGDRGSQLSRASAVVVLSCLSRGMRLTVYDVLSYLAAGMTVAEILDDFPYLTPEDIQACFAFAAEATLAEDWLRPEEDAAWSHLQPGK
jgi:hypothetical protein